jgi:hypothetical protein
MSFIQFFGSALQVTPHFHSLVPDGVFLPREGGVRLEALPPPTQAEVERLLKVVRHRMLRLLKKEGPCPRKGPKTRGRLGRRPHCSSGCAGRRWTCGPLPESSPAVVRGWVNYFRRALEKLPAETTKEVRAMLSPEGLAVMVGVTATWLGTQGIPVVGQAVDAALLALGVIALASQATVVTDAVWNYVKCASEARDYSGLELAATHLAVDTQPRRVHQQACSHPHQ